MSKASRHILFGIPKLPPKYALVVMPLLMSGFMSSIVSMVATVRALGWSLEVLRVWPFNWLWGWAVAFPVLFLMIPIVKRMTQWLVRLPD